MSQPPPLSSPAPRLGEPQKVVESAWLAESSSSSRCGAQAYTANKKNLNAEATEFVPSQNRYEGMGTGMNSLMPSKVLPNLSDGTEQDMYNWQNYDYAAMMMQYPPVWSYVCGEYNNFIPGNHGGGSTDLSHIQRPKQQGGNTTKLRDKRRRSRARLRQSSPLAAPDEADNCSSALDSFRNDREHFRLETAMSHLSEFAKDLEGHRFIIDELEKASGNNGLLFRNCTKKLTHDISKLAKDQYGTLVIQKLFELGNSDQKNEWLQEIKSDALELSNHQHGCRVVQKTLESVANQKKVELAKLIEPNVCAIIENKHGNHVVQKCIEELPPDEVTFIIDAVLTKTSDMAMSKYGCRVIQRLLEYCNPEQLKQLLEDILNILPKLADNDYGNYVVQHMLEYGRPDDRKTIIGIIQSDIVKFANSKFSSNIVEKCLEKCLENRNDAGSMKLEWEDLMHVVLEQKQGQQQGQPSNSPLQLMMIDKFGHYIVMKLIDYCNSYHELEKERDIVMKQIREVEADVDKGSMPAKAVVSKVKELGWWVQHQVVQSGQCEL